MDFSSWLIATQGLDADSLTDEVKAIFRQQYEGWQRHAEAVMSGPPLNPGTTGGCKYAVAIDDGTDLRLTLWVRRAPDICVVLQPRGAPPSIHRRRRKDRPKDWDPHATYHQDGKYHQKSFDMKSMKKQLQRLDNFKGTEHLGSFGGHGGSLPKCDPHDYTDVMRVSAGVLSGLRGGVIVDLVEPGVAPSPLHREFHEVIQEKTYKDFSPWVVVAVVVPRAA